MSPPRAALLLAGGFLALEASARAAGSDGYFESRIKPLLDAHCSKCHSTARGKTKGKLSLDSASDWALGGSRGPAVVAHNPGESLLIRAVEYEDEDLQMPPDRKLAARVRRLLREWVMRGAPGPEGAVAAVKAAATRKSGPERAGPDFWCFQPIRAPVVPEPRDAAWPAGDIDRFVRARLEAAGVEPVEDADRYTWLRRVTFDLTGLPPTPDEIRAFVSDTAPGAFERVVDRLLGSPGFGEHWARHWLDLACYADTTESGGMPLVNAWRYRDYVIASLNADKPLDRFALEQLAGDLLPAASDPQRREQLIATGFLALGPWTLQEQDKEKLRMDIVDHQINLVGRTFLGMSLDCARCHPHKFDPISSHDYYGLAGIFGSSEVLNGRWRSNLSAPAMTELPETPEERAARVAALPDYERRLQAAREKRDRLRQELRAAEGAGAGAAQARAEELKKQLDEQQKAVGFLEFNRPVPPAAHAIHDVQRPADCQINLRGNHRSLGESVPRGAIAVVAARPLPIARETSGRRQLAEWLTAPENPLTSRVLANRVWHHLVGAGIVRSVDYFGLSGDRPTHPELLDYLALRLRDTGWSLKSLVREIVLSRTYRLSSHDTPAGVARDPDNRLLWRAHRRRLDAEMIRDALLFVSGALRPERGGPSLPVDIPENVDNGDEVNPPKIGMSKMPEERLNRRTIYQPIYGTLQPSETGMLNIFDFPVTTLITGARRTTTVPTQSLFLLNAPFVKERAAGLARLVAREGQGDEARLTALWLRAVGRPPTAAEVAEARHFVAAAGPGSAAWAGLARALLATNSFVFRL